MREGRALYLFSLTRQPRKSYTDPIYLTTAQTGQNYTASEGGAAAGIYFVHADHLNTPRLVTNGAGEAVWRWDQTDPFGGNVANENPAGLGTFAFNLRLPGQYFDKETNLHYNYFRDYDPATGRYPQSDPIGLEGGLNTYAYAASNPLMLSDPFGLDWKICCMNRPITRPTSDDEDRVGASSDFSRNYREMRQAWTKGADKYFHCKANCEATQRGPAGYVQAKLLSNFREFTDQVRPFSPPPSESALDQGANAFGREMARRNLCGDCRVICQPYRPAGLPAQY